MVSKICILTLIGLITGMVSTAMADEFPHYASLKSNKIYLRTGPGKKFPILWVYQEKGYPVEVIDQYDTWRQIRESDGTIGWVHQAMLGDSRTALIQEENFLTDKPSINGQTVAIIQQGTIGRIVRCPDQNQYCLLSFKYHERDVKGWFPRRLIWGLQENEEID